MAQKCNTCNGNGFSLCDEACPTCKGHGMEKFYQPGYGEAIRVCRECGGEGTVAKVVVCPDCKGMGYTD